MSPADLAHELLAHATGTASGPMSPELVAELHALAAYGETRHADGLARALSPLHTRHEAAKRAAWLENLRRNAVRDADGLLKLSNPLTGPLSVPVRMGEYCDARR